MIYLAILLILCGMLILISALFIETGRVNAAGYINSGIENNKTELPSEEIEVIFPDDGIVRINDEIDEEDIFISFDDDSADLSELELLSEKNNKNIESFNSGKVHQRFEEADIKDHKSDHSAISEIIEKSENRFAVQSGGDGKVSAVMFDDRSNIIDYEAGAGVIDSTFSKYKSIKRIGKGDIESDYDGINFYIDEKLYRFDFHKVYDIWSGSDYIALPLKGNSTVKLFIIENSAGFPYKVEADFKEYEKGL